jgi:hypothetical protein
VLVVVVTVRGCEGGEGWRVEEEGGENVVIEVVEGTEKRTVGSYRCEKAAEVEDGSGRLSPLLLPAKPACECT